MWVNLPASYKRMKPRYRDVKRYQIPEAEFKEDMRIKVISGVFNGTRGPVQDIVVDIAYLDVALEPRTRFEHPFEAGYTVFAYVFEGAGFFDSRKKTLINMEHLVLYQGGDAVTVSTEEDPVRFLLVSGKPLKEPVAWYGPIVMNTQEELDPAFEEYRNGTFIKQG